MMLKTKKPQMESSTGGLECFKVACIKHLPNYLEPGTQWPNARISQLALRFCDMPKNPVPILSRM